MVASHEHCFTNYAEEDGGTRTHAAWLDLAYFSRGRRVTDEEACEIEYYDYSGCCIEYLA